MPKEKKGRLNLYLREEIIQFAKNWSYVTGKPISQMLDEYLEQQKRTVSSVTAFQWLNDPTINPSLPDEDSYFKDLNEYILNRDEEKFCADNPEHPRAKMRRTLVKEHEKYVSGKLEKQKIQEKELIKRWLEKFPAQK